MPGPIYFDNNATTRPLDEVVEAMLPFLRDRYANPSSVHQFGQAVRHKVECAREQVAGLIGASPKEIVFTAGGTESINLAIRGTLAATPAGTRLVTSAVEHSAVRRLGEQLAREGVVVDVVGVDGEGRLNLDELADKLTDDTALLSVMYANNETGVMFDVEPIAALATERGVPVHLDAVQAVGKVPIDLSKLPVQLLSLSGHKFHGPKGAGALFVRRRTRIRPLIIGGRQERDLRGGTENVPAIIGLGAAAQAATQTLGETADYVGRLRDRLERGTCDSVPTAGVNGRGAPRIYNTTNVGFRDIEAEAILLLLSESGVCASAGSACSSGSLEPSHVLQAMKVDPRLAHGAVRFSLSRFNTEAEVDRVVEMMPALLDRLTVLHTR
ncbi:MAG TPA: aminotransferase class V-fold PLP-dependent enzyme [Phycisphaerae bacterium]|nr:aminotransferase class V-fold PLP-dependent enzyme [Phycisphaerae bacterium]